MNLHRIRPISCTAAVALCFATSTVAAEWTTGCDEAGGHCTVQGLLVTPEGQRSGTLGLQVGRDGQDAVLFVTTPLGAALVPGVKLRASGRDFDLRFDVCYPDGCRASLGLGPEDLAAFLDLESVDLLLFAYGEAEPAILAAPLSGLVEAFGGQVSLPD